MSYSISVSGHKQTQNEAESRSFEEMVKAKAIDFVRSLEGVTGATGSFGAIGTVDLKAASEEEVRTRTLGDPDAEGPGNPQA